MPLLWIFLIISSFLIGSIPFGYLIGRHFAGIDITKIGSRNIGATNISREAGLKFGIATLLLDALKGFIPVLISSLLYGNNISLVWFSGLSAILGHQFSLFLKFRGGKGVATAIGVYLFISPLQVIIALILFLIAVRIWDFISLGSIVFSLIMPLILFASGRPTMSVITSCVIAALIIVKHWGNIHSIFKGDERRWSSRKIR